MANLRGKIVAITGAGGGIGKALTLSLLEAGADVFASDINTKNLDPLIKSARDKSGRLITTIADVTDEVSMVEFRDKIISQRDHIDYWINNAGITYIAAFQGCDVAVYQQVIDINQGGVIRGTRLALESMESRGRGTIVNVASIAGHLPAPYMSAYNTSKHAVVGFTRSLNAELELAGSSVKLILASPGFANTDIISRGANHGFPEWLSFMLSTPDEVATEIIRGMVRGKREIFPTLNGKVMRRMYAMLPRATVKSSKVLFARSLKDAVLNRLNVPDDKL